MEDVFSLIKTGLTVEELEELEKLLAEIEKLMEERKKAVNKSELNEEIAKKLKGLEKAVMELQKRINGGNEMQFDKKIGETGSEDEIPDPSGFKERIEYLEKTIKRLKDGLINKDTTTRSTDEELQLMQEYKRLESSKE